LLLILPAIEIDEGGDGADFGARGVGRGLALGGRGARDKKDRDAKKKKRKTARAKTHVLSPNGAQHSLAMLGIKQRPYKIPDL
jgi:hypothetical protein